MKAYALAVNTNWDIEVLTTKTNFCKKNVFNSFYIDRNIALFFFYVLAKENICDVIKILLENNSAKLGLNLRNESVLYLAMVAGQRIRTNNVESVTYQLVKTLLRNEADPNEHSRDHIPLFVALETGDVMTSKLLLNASANINATNRRGKCSLHIIYENTWATGKDN